MIRILPLFLLCTISLSAADNGIDLDKKTREQCLAVLRKGLRSDEFWPSMHAAEGLTFSGHGDEVINLLTPLLDKESDGQHRCGIARELARSGEAERSEVMLKILKGNDPYAHVHAAESLYKVGWNGDGTPVVYAFRNSDDPRLKLMAAAALAKRGSQAEKMEALIFLRETLSTEKDPEVFRLAAWVLARVGDPSDIPALRKRSADAHGEIARAMLENALAALGDPEGQDALRRNLASQEPAVKAQAATFAGEFHIPNTVPVLIEMLNDPVLDARIRAAHSLLVLDQ